VVLIVSLLMAHIISLESKPENTVNTERYGKGVAGS
jgi:hypothetical protein